MYRALVSFSGLVSMAKGEVREISNLTIVNDLLNAGYIEEVKSEVKTEKPKRTKAKK